MAVKLAQVGVFALVTLLYVLTWPSVPKNESGLAGIFIVDVTLSGVLAAWLVWFRSGVRRWDRKVRSRGFLSGVCVGIATILIAWVLHSIVMFFVVKMQVGLFSVFRQNGQKFLWRAMHESSALVVPLLYGVTGLVVKSLFSKR